VYCRHIRRTALTPQPTEQIRLGVSSPEDIEARRDLAKTAAKRKRRRGPGGLGRGLARILTDSDGPNGGLTPRPGLVELVGGQSAVRLSALEATVADAALRALMESFELQALAVAVSAGPEPGDVPAHRIVLAPGWSAERGIGALLERELGAMLAQPATVIPAEARHREIPVDGHRLWLYRAVEDGRVFVAGGVRHASLPASSGGALGAAVQALASSLADRRADLNLRHSMQRATNISLKSEGGDVLAEVNADWPLPEGARNGSRGRRTGVGRAGEPVLAVARAAAKACRPRCEVLFAGLTRCDDGDVAVALVRHHQHGLRVGWAERPRGDLRAVTEAVFTASL
jgi:hypothetical protein